MSASKKLIARMICAVSLLAALGCVGPEVSLGSEAGMGSARTGGRSISAEAAGFQLFLFIPISVNSRHERAYGSLVNQANGGFITDVQVQESWTYGFVGTVYRVRMDATVYPN